MRQILIVLIFSGILFSCSVQQKMIRQFEGCDKTELDQHFGQRGSIVRLSDDKQYVSYSKSKFLRSTPISKGVTTLDPMVSPSVEKQEKYIFYLDKNGKVTDCKVETKYQK